MGRQFVQGAVSPDADARRASASSLLASSRCRGSRCALPAIPGDGLRQAVVEARPRAPPEQSCGAGGVERAAWLAVGLGGIPSQPAAEAGERGDLLREI